MWLGLLEAIQYFLFSVSSCHDLVPDEKFWFFFFKSQTFQQSEFCSIAKFILKNGEVLFGKRCPPVRKS